VSLAQTLQAIQPFIWSMLLKTLAVDGGLGIKPVVLTLLCVLVLQITLTVTDALPLAPVESHAFATTL